MTSSTQTKAFRSSISEEIPVNNLCFFFVYRSFLEIRVKAFKSVDPFVVVDNSCLIKWQRSQERESHLLH